MPKLPIDNSKIGQIYEKLRSIMLQFSRFSRHMSCWIVITLENPWLIFEIFIYSWG